MNLKEENSSILNACPKCLKYALTFDRKSNALRCSSCGFEQKIKR